MSAPIGQSAFEGEQRSVSSGFDDRETAASRRLCVAVALELRPEPSVILDVGCGGGQILSQLRARCPHSVLVGIDPVEAALSEARHLLSDDDDAVLIATTAESFLPSADLPPIDLAICHLNLALWADPVSGLRAVARALAPGGVIYVVDLARADGSARERLLRRAQTDAERVYLAEQLEIGMNITSAQVIAENVCGAEELRDITFRVARGGLAGYGFDTAQASRLWNAPEVRAAIDAFARPSDGASDLDVLHWEFRRAQ